MIACHPSSLILNLFKSWVGLLYKRPHWCNIFRAVFVENKLKKLQTQKQPEVSGVVKLKPKEIISQLKSLNDFQLRQPSRSGGEAFDAFCISEVKDCNYIDKKLHPERIGVTLEELAHLIEHDQLLVETTNSQVEKPKDLETVVKPDLSN